jgi:hypothetical protein
MGTTYWWIFKNKDRSAWKISLMITLAFFIFYRKIHGNYYLYPLALLTPFYFMERDIRWKMWLLIALVLSTQLFVSERAEFIVTPIILSLSTLALLVYLFLKLKDGKDITVIIACQKSRHKNS